MESRTVDRILYVLIIVAIGYAVMYPIGLPISVSNETRQAHDFLNTIPAGSAVYMSFDYGAATMTELEPSAVAFMRHLFARDVRVIMAGLSPESGDVADKVMKMLEKDFPNKKYGQDWVNIGYKPGVQVFLQALAADISNAAGGVDVHGTRLETLPLTNEIKSLSDVAAVIGVTSMYDGLAAYVKMIGAPLGVPVTGACGAVSISDHMPLLNAGQIKGLLKGQRGAAEYENIINKPGTASAGMDAQSLTYLLMVVFIIIGNIQHFMSKRQPKGEATNV